MGISATRCHVCGTSLRFSLAAFSKKFSGVFGEHPAPVTTVLLIANILMLGVSWMALVATGGGGRAEHFVGAGRGDAIPPGSEFSVLYFLHE